MLSQCQARLPHPSDVQLLGVVAAPPLSRPRSAPLTTVATSLPGRRHDRLLLPAQTGPGLRGPGLLLSSLEAAGGLTGQQSSKRPWHPGMGLRCEWSQLQDLLQGQQQAEPGGGWEEGGDGQSSWQ